MTTPRAADPHLHRDTDTVGNATMHEEYDDYANVSAAWVAEQSRQIQQTTGKRSAGGPKMIFPLRLYDMLEIESSHNSPIVRFQPHGRAFKIYDRAKFESDVLPKYFRFQSTYASFQRQLNVYSFQRLTTKGPDQHAYYHCQLIRGRRDVCALIQRDLTPNKTMRRKLDLTTEPDFGQMTSLPDSGAAPHQTVRDQVPEEPLFPTLTCSEHLGVVPPVVFASEGVQPLCFVHEDQTRAAKLPSLSLPPSHCSVSVNTQPDHVGQREHTRPIDINAVHSTLIKQYYSVLERPREHPTLTTVHLLDPRVEGIIRHLEPEDVSSELRFFATPNEPPSAGDVLDMSQSCGADMADWLEDVDFDW